MTILWNNSRGELEAIIQQYSLCLWWILGKRTWLWYKKELQNWEMISQPKLEITVEPVLRGLRIKGSLLRSVFKVPKLSPLNYFSESHQPLLSSSTCVERFS